MQDHSQRRTWLKLSADRINWLWTASSPNVFAKLSIINATVSIIKCFIFLFQFYLGQTTRYCHAITIVLGTHNGIGANFFPWYNFFFHVNLIVRLYFKWLVGKWPDYVMSIPWSAQSSFPFYVSFFFSLMIRLLFNLSYFQLNLDPGSVSVKSWGTLHLIKFS